MSFLSPWVNSESSEPKESACAGAGGCGRERRGPHVGLHRDLSGPRHYILSVLRAPLGSVRSLSPAQHLQRTLKCWLHSQSPPCDRGCKTKTHSLPFICCASQGAEELLVCSGGSTETGVPSALRAQARGLPRGIHARRLCLLLRGTRGRRRPAAPALPYRPRPAAGPPSAHRRLASPAEPGRTPGRPPPARPSPVEPGPPRSAGALRTGPAPRPPRTERSPAWGARGCRALPGFTERPGGHNENLRPLPFAAIKPGPLVAPSWPRTRSRDEVGSPSRLRARGGCAGGREGDLDQRVLLTPAADTHKTYPASRGKRQLRMALAEGVALSSQFGLFEFEF